MNQVKETQSRWNMKNRFFFSIIACILLCSDCRKDDPPVIAHSHLTRIDYTVNEPFEMPHIAFSLNNNYDLTGNARCSLILVADEHASSLNLMIMLEDESGHRTDESPFIIAEEEIIKDDHSHTYSYGFSTSLQSSTSNTSEIDIRRIKKVLVFINAGTTGKVSKGYFWLDKVQFDQD